MVGLLSLTKPRAMPKKKSGAGGPKAVPDPRLTDAADAYVLGFALQPGRKRAGGRPPGLRCAPLPDRLRVQVPGSGQPVVASACVTVDTMLTLHGVCHGEAYSCNPYG